MTRAYEEIIDLFVGSQAKQVADFEPSDESRQRVAYLLGRSKDETLSPEESCELDDYLQLEHLMRLAKARARQRLSNE